MKLFSVAAIFVLTLVVGRAQEIRPLTAEQERMKPEAIQLTGFEWVVPELILGGEWTSIIKLTNRGTAPIPPTNVNFFDNNGNPMTTTFQTTAGSIVTGTGFSFTLPVGGVVEGTFWRVQHAVRASFCWVFSEWLWNARSLRRGGTAKPQFSPT